jgi:hypothetical protein
LSRPQRDVLTTRRCGRWGGVPVGLCMLLEYGDHLRSPRPAEVCRQSCPPRRVPAQSPWPGKVIVGVCGPSRASAACRALLPPGVGCSRLSWAPVVCCGPLLSEAGARCLSRAGVACRGPAVVAAAAAAAACCWLFAAGCWCCCCCCCCCCRGAVPRNHGNKCASSSPDQKSLRRACSSGMGGGIAPEQAHPRRVAGTQGQTRSTHKAYPLKMYAKHIWKRQNRTFTIRFAHHNALFEHESNHITSLSACVLGTLVAGWLAKNSSALRAKNKHCFISNIWNYYPGNMRL